MVSLLTRIQNAEALLPERSGMLRNITRIPIRQFAWILGVAFILAAGSLDAYHECIGTLDDFVRSADTIVVGTTVSVQDRDFMEIHPWVGRFMLGTLTVLTALSILAYRFKGWRAVMVIVSIGTLFGGAVLWLGTGGGFGVYTRAATISVDWSVDDVTREPVLRVFFDHEYCCDTTDFQPGDRYLLFLAEDVDGYHMTGFDCGQFKVLDGSVKPRRYRDWTRSSSLDDLLTRIENCARR